MHKGLCGWYLLLTSSSHRVIPALRANKSPVSWPISVNRIRISVLRPVLVGVDPPSTPVVYCAADFGLGRQEGGQEGGGRIIRPIIFAFCCAVPAWRIVQIAHDLHKKAQFCTFGRDLSSICNVIKHDWRLLLGGSTRHPRHELALQKVQIARSTFAHFGKLHSICPNAFPSP
jgi:hypothetical protein